MPAADTWGQLERVDTALGALGAKTRSSKRPEADRSPVGRGLTVAKALPSVEAMLREEGHLPAEEITKRLSTKARREGRLSAGLPVSPGEGSRAKLPLHLTAGKLQEAF